MKVNEELEKELERFTEPQKAVVREFLKVLAKRTRDSGKISASRQVKIVAEWKEFDADVIVDGLQTFMKMSTTSKQKESYVKGIIKNKQEAKNQRGAKYETNRNNASNGGGTEKTKQDESGRVEQLFSGTTINREFNCDF